MTSSISVVRPVRSLSLFIFGVAVGWPAISAELEGAIDADEITVTARKRAETVRDVPATVFVFSEQDIERSNITRAGDIALLTPGVSLVDAAEAGDTQVNIRGMNGARDAENSYALVIDGITMSNPASLNREYSNLQQIEVLKGPQGAIYGRNGSAGAFIITTRIPEDQVTGKIIASGGEDETFSIVGDVSGPISDSVRGSLLGEAFTTNGYYSNAFLGADDIVDNREQWALTGRLIFDVSDRTEIDTKMRYSDLTAGSISYNSVFHLPTFRGVDPAFYEDVNDHPYNFFNNVVHTNDQSMTEFSVKLDHELDWATFTTWALYSDIENQLGADGTSAAFGFFFADQPCIDTTGNLQGFPLNPPQAIGPDPANSLFGAYTPTTCDGTQYQRRNQQDVSFEARLASNGDGPLQWMGGVYLLNIEREVAVNTGIDRLNAPGYSGAEVLQTTFTTDPTNPTEQLVWDEFTTDVYSIFGQVGYDITDTFTVDFALRYDREEREVESLVPTVAEGGISQYINPCPASDGLTPGVDTPLNPGLCPSNLGSVKKSRDFDQWQPKVSFTWDAFESTTFFGSWGVGFRSGGFNNTGSEATVNTFINDALFNIQGNPGLCDPFPGGVADPTCIGSGRSRVGILDTYEQETSSAFELGFKSEFLDNAVRLEAAAYYNTVDDMQFFEFIVGPFGLLRVVENIDEVQITGVEAGVTWDAAEWLDLFVGGNFNDTEIKANAVRPDTVGNESPYTPRYTGNLGAYFNWPLGAGGASFFTNVDVATVGKTWFHVVQDQVRPIGFELAFGFGNPGQYRVARRDVYTLANLRLGVESERWTAALWVTNLTDERYLEENIPAPEFGGSFGQPGTKRRVGADFTWRFY